MGIKYFLERFSQKTMGTASLLFALNTIPAGLAIAASGQDHPEAPQSEAAVSDCAVKITDWARDAKNKASPSAVEDYKKAYYTLADVYFTQIGMAELGGAALDGKTKEGQIQIREASVAARVKYFSQVNALVRNDPKLMAEVAIVDADSFRLAVIGNHDDAFVGLFYKAPKQDQKIMSNSAVAASKAEKAKGCRILANLTVDPNGAISKVQVDPTEEAPSVSRTIVFTNAKELENFRSTIRSLVSLDMAASGCKEEEIKAPQKRRDFMTNTIKELGVSDGLMDSSLVSPDPKVAQDDLRVLYSMVVTRDPAKKAVVEKLRAENPAGASVMERVDSQGGWILAPILQPKVTVSDPKTSEAPSMDNL